MAGSGGGGGDEDDGTKPSASEIAEGRGRIWRDTVMPNEPSPGNGHRRRGDFGSEILGRPMNVTERRWAGMQWVRGCSRMWLGMCRLPGKMGSFGKNGS